MQAGDTLSNIAASNGLTLDALLKCNPQITNTDLIKAGDVISLCSGSGSTTGEHELCLPQAG